MSIPIERGRFAKELLALNFEEYGGVFVQEDTEEGVPHLVRSGVDKVVCDHREKYVPCYEMSASHGFHTKG